MYQAPGGLATNDGDVGAWAPGLVFGGGGGMPALAGAGAPGLVFGEGGGMPAPAGAAAAGWVLGGGGGVPALAGAWAPGWGFGGDGTAALAGVGAGVPGRVVGGPASAVDICSARAHH